ncbi:MAG: lipid-binding SYLF domain-containing protein [Phycisphaerales bacterium]|nr:lipid-binding SYLF domain-containing protein [Phycisphaerales bacterium]
MCYRLTICALFLLTLTYCFGCSSGSSAPKTEGARVDLANSTASALATFKADPRSSKFFDTAYGWAVFPKITKGAAGIGVAQGQGEVYQGGAMTGWVKITSVTVGAQLGGQSFSEIIFFQNQWAYDKFTNNQFAGQATATAVAGKKGGGQIADYSDGVAVFTSNNDGLIVAADVGGQQFDFTPR